MVLSQHAPSHLTVANQRVLLSYAGQPPTCYGCGESGHMYQGCPARHKNGTKKTSMMSATYASIVTEVTATKEGPSQDIATASGTVEEEESAPAAIVDWRETGDDIGISVVQMEPPDPTNTDAQLATLDGIENDIIDTSHCTAQVEPCQRMEVTEPKGDFPTCPEGESRTRTIKSRGASPVERREENGAICEDVEKAMTDMGDTFLTGKGNGLRRSCDVAQSEIKR